jgi:hypothetical protein
VIDESSLCVNCQVLTHPGTSQQIGKPKSRSTGSNFSMEANHGHSWDGDCGEGTGRSSPQVGEFDCDEPEAGAASSASVRYTRIRTPTSGPGDRVEIPVARHTAQVRDFLLLHDHGC